jgi:hypothetical protein
MHRKTHIKFTTLVLEKAGFITAEGQMKQFISQVYSLYDLYIQNYYIDKDAKEGLVALRHPPQLDKVELIYYAASAVANTNKSKREYPLALFLLLWVAMCCR